VIDTKKQVPQSIGGSAQNWHLKISEDFKKSVRRLFRQLPSDARADNKIGKVLSFGNSSGLLGVGPDHEDMTHHLKAGCFGRPGQVTGFVFM
jgi:hypothetical protein